MPSRVAFLLLHNYPIYYARVAELVDAPDLGSGIPWM